MMNKVRVEVDSIKVTKNSVHNIVRRLIIENAKFTVEYTETPFVKFEIVLGGNLEVATLGDFVCFVAGGVLVLKESQHRLSMAMRGELIDA